MIKMTPPPTPVCCELTMPRQRREAMAASTTEPPRRPRNSLKHTDENNSVMTDRAIECSEYLPGTNRRGERQWQHGTSYSVSCPHATTTCSFVCVLSSTYDTVRGQLHHYLHSLQETRHGHLCYVSCIWDMI